MKVLDARVQRIYTPITKDLVITTPWAYVNGKVSYKPLEAEEFSVETMEDVKKSKMGVVDSDYSLIAGQKGHSENGQLELTLIIPDEAANPNKGHVKLGVDANSLPIFPSGSVSTEQLVVGGSFGEKTLEVIARLADKGSYLRINGMHIDADDNKHFTSKMIERQYNHDGSSAGDTNILYPRAQANHEQTTIRQIPNMDVYLDGFGYIEIPVYKGIEVNLTLDTTYVK